MRYFRFEMGLPTRYFSNSTTAVFVFCLVFLLHISTAQLDSNSDGESAKLALPPALENHKPMFINCSLYNASVLEGRPRKTDVIRVHAIEYDPPDKKGGRVSYKIVRGPDEREYFKIDNKTGQIVTNIEFDRDEPARQKEFYLTVEASDDGKPPLADICAFKVTILDYNDNSPNFDTAEYKVQVSEDTKKGSEVMRVFAYDFDEGENARLTYKFDKNTPERFKEYFNIDPNTGVITLGRLTLKGEVQKKFAATVEVRDNGEPQRQSTAEISIIVVGSDKKQPTVTDYQNTITIPENYFNVDEPLVAITAESNIADKSLAFELIRGKTPQTNSNQNFVLNPKTNTTAVITLARYLDYETVTEYHLTVRVQNKDGLSTAVNIVVHVTDVNDEFPQFIESIKGSVVENDAIGVQAMQVRAIDKDGTSPNNIVRYELQDHNDMFSIDPETGVIKTKQQFDAEQEQVVNVIVSAYDGAPSALKRDKNEPNVAFQTLTISIEDQNDNKPKFPKALYTADSVSESSDSLKLVIEIKAEDPDKESELRYSIIEGNVDDAFSIGDSVGRILVNNKLDFEKIEKYNLTVRVTDGIYEDTTKVEIFIVNENDERPIFDPYNGTIVVPEETLINKCVLTLSAYDPDIKDRDADQKISYKVPTQYDFLSVTSHGCVTIVKKLDRDYPNGSPKYQGYIYAYDNDGAPNSLSTGAEINVILEDINDNAPILNMTEVVWYENQPPGMITKLEAIDYDAPQNGPPFHFEIDPQAFEIQEMFSIMNDMQLQANVQFDREEKKFYDVPIKITDSGEPPQSGISVLRVIIGDRNDNAAKDGSSEIFVYKYDAWKNDIPIGRVYVDDLDDWDLPDKVFTPVNGLGDDFYLIDGGMIAMRSTTQPGEYKLNFVVTEESELIQKHDVNADVTVTVKSIPEEAVRKSGSIRIAGTTIEEFIEKDPATHLSKKDILQNHLAKSFNTSVSNVDIMTVLTSPSNGSYIDVRFSAHGSPYYLSEKLNSRASEEQVSLEQKLGVKFVMVNINECMKTDACPQEKDSCTNELFIGPEQASVFTNKTSFVGVNATAQPKCDCGGRITEGCLNGAPTINDSCDCPEGAAGPNCAILGVGFTGDSWAMYPGFDSCNDTTIVFYIIPKTSDGLIFYVGPVTKYDAIFSKSFMSLELRDGFVVLKYDLGVGTATSEVVWDSKKIDDDTRHKIEIHYTITDIMVNIDDSPSELMKWENLKQSGLLKINGPLQMGGRKRVFKEEEAKIIWENAPTSRFFVGCITNFTYNGFLYNLGGPSDSYHTTNCNYGVMQAVTFGIDSNFLVAILVCIAILLILLLVVVVHKRKQDKLHEKDMDDTCENIINYEDEGGGECDASDFDLRVLQANPDEKQPVLDTMRYVDRSGDVPADIGSFLDDKKRACDKDNLPYDDVRHYGYEGDGNTSGSLSSLASCTDDGDLKFNYLSSFGPRFRKLADMYGDDGSEEESQNGGEESWC